MTRQPDSCAHGHLVVVLDCADLDRAARFRAGALVLRPPADYWASPAG